MILKAIGQIGLAIDNLICCLKEIQGKMTN